MAELTPISAEQRRAYYDALPAGRDEAARLGYGLIDDRIFAAFHRALYRPMLDAHEAEVRAKVAEEIAKAIEDTKPSSAHFWDTADTATVYALNRAAAIARTCVVHMPGAVQEGAEPPDAYPSEGGADSGAQKPAQEGVG